MVVKILLIIFFVLFVAPVAIYALFVVFAHRGVIVENFSAKKKKMDEPDMNQEESWSRSSGYNSAPLNSGAYNIYLSACCA